MTAVRRVTPHEFLISPAFGTASLSPRGKLTEAFPTFYSRTIKEASKKYGIVIGIVPDRALVVLLVTLHILPGRSTNPNFDMSDLIMYSKQKRKDMNGRSSVYAGLLVVL